MEYSSFSAFIEDVRARNNIVDVIGKYVQLDKRGSNYWACCPIHSERTPSFAVNEAEGYYHCFGCGAHGNVFSFVMEMESCSFYDALKILAERVGLTIPDFSSSASSEKRREHKERLYNLMREAGLHYHANLSDERAKPAVDYIEKRGLGKATVRNFAIGYSLGFQELITHLKSKGFTREEMLEAGVAEEKNGALFDAQHGRLIVPILNNTNKVIAFGGRYIGDTDFAKYKNTKETIIFEKRKELFGVHTLKRVKQERKLDEIIVVEGYMDVISLHQAGIRNACASMGTALTPEQCKTLRFLCDNIYLCYDGDGAGQKATYRGIDILKDAGLNTKVMILPTGLDPDDVVKKYGADKFYQLMREAVTPTMYKLKSIEKTYNMSDPEEKGKYAIAAVNAVAELKEIVEREVYLPMIAEKSGIDVNILRKQLEGAQVIAPEKLRTDFTPSANKAYYEAARFILYALYSGTVCDNQDLSGLFEDDEHKKLYNSYRIIVSSGKPDVNMLLDDDLKEGRAIIDADYDKQVEDKAEYYKDCVSKLEKDYKDKLIKELNKAFYAAETPEEKTDILAKIQKLKSTRIN